MTDLLGYNSRLINALTECLFVIAHLIKLVLSTSSKSPYLKIVQ